MENKYRNWCFTFNELDNYLLPESKELYAFLEKEFDTFVFQLEKGEETERLHYQGCLVSKIRMRQPTVLKKFQSHFPDMEIAALTVNKMMGTWEENFEYCTKEETRAGEKPFLSRSLQTYSGADIEFFSDRRKWHPWQEFVYSIIYSAKEINEIHDDRTIYWITDKKGCTGKSKFTKYLCFNDNDIVKVPFGTATQMRSSIISAGPRKVYLLDIPRTLGDDDSLNSMISTLEDIKNGFVTTAMYGVFKQLIFECPTVIVFSNQECPTHSMSKDRWQEFSISSFTKEMMVDNYDGTTTPCNY